MKNSFKTFGAFIVALSLIVWLMSTFLIVISGPMSHQIGFDDALLEVWARRVICGIATGLLLMYFPPKD